MPATWPVVLTCLLAVLLGASDSHKADFVVSPNGDDNWSGRLATPNRTHTDGPFVTLERAQEAVRELKQREPNRNGPILVMVRGGTYFLNKPIVLTPEDSGTAAAPVVYAAYPGEEPLISGAVQLTGWTQDARAYWQLHIPEVERGEWTFSQLFVNGQRRPRPRLPKEGYYAIADALPPSPKAEGKGSDRFQFSPGDIRGDWANLEDVEVLCLQIWTMARMPIASVDERQHIVAFTGHTPGTDWWASLPKGNRFLVENVREALEKPGEWYLDRKSGVLTYIPLPGEDIRKAVVIAPRLEHLVALKGDIGARKWAQHIVFQGLTFSHTNWNRPPEGHSFPQAEADLGGAISAEGARFCALEDCTITQVGSYAVEWGAGCKYNRVENCELTDLGAGGVKIGLMGAAEDEEAVASHQIVRNNLIAHGGRIHPAAVGVWIGHSPYNRIEHNDIYDFYYTGVSVGWSWGYGGSLAHHNIVAFNHIYQIGQGLLSDMGGIYTLGISPGTVLYQNRIHDVESFSYGGWGIYFDEGSTEILAENNIVYRTKSGGFHQHYGKENRVWNNIFALAREAQIIRSRVQEHLSFTFRRNIVYWKEGALLGGNWSGDQYALDYNLYWNASGQPVQFGEMTLAQWRQNGQDAQSVIADPLFVDVETEDFRLQPGSPAISIGFKPIDTSRIGRLASGQAERAVQIVPPAFPIR